VSPLEKILRLAIGHPGVIGPLFLRHPLNLVCFNFDGSHIFRREAASTYELINKKQW